LAADGFHVGAPRRREQGGRSGVIAGFVRRIRALPALLQGETTRGDPVEDFM
jgi:hypothetical protein